MSLYRRPRNWAKITAQFYKKVKNQLPRHHYDQPPVLEVEVGGQVPLPGEGPRPGDRPPVLEVVEQPPGNMNFRPK